MSYHITTITNEGYPPQQNYVQAEAFPVQSYASPQGEVAAAYPHGAAASQGFSTPAQYGGYNGPAQAAYVPAYPTEASGGPQQVPIATSYAVPPPAYNPNYNPPQTYPGQAYQQQQQQQQQQQHPMMGQPAVYPSPQIYTPQGAPVYPNPQGYGYPPPVHQPNIVGGQAICRRCHRPFNRKPGVHDGMAQFYRCEDCCQLRATDFCNLS